MEEHHQKSSTPGPIGQFSSHMTPGSTPGGILGASGIDHQSSHYMGADIMGIVGSDQRGTIPGYSMMVAPSGQIASNYILKLLYFITLSYIATFRCFRYIVCANKYDGWYV